MSQITITHENVQVEINIKKKCRGLLRDIMGVFPLVKICYFMGLIGFFASYCGSEGRT